MSQTEPSTDDLLELIQSEPEEAFRNHSEKLREMRDDADSERVKTVINCVLDEYVNDGGGG